MKVLIADDSISMRKIVSNILVQLGYTEIVETCNGKDAFEMLEKARFDLIISDWNMPQMNGLELLKAVRKSKNHMDVPFIMATAEGLKQNISAAFDAGATDFVAKPFSADIMAETLKKIFDENNGMTLTVENLDQAKSNDFVSTDKVPDLSTISTSQFVTFKVDDNLVGINILDVREINRVLDITPVQHSPDYVRGLINLRGKTVTVFDLGVRLGMTPREITSESQNIILKKDGVGLLVDSIGDVVEAKDDDVHTPPANIRGVEGKFVQGIVSLEEKLLVVLSADKILEYKPAHNKE